MARRPALLAAGLALLVALTGCHVVTPTTAKKAAATKATLAPTPAPAVGDSKLVANPGGTLLSNNGSSVISNNAGSLVGVVKIPASLISDGGSGIVSDHGNAIISNNSGALVSDQGGAIVSDHGNGLISNNSGSYRLQAADGLPQQLPLVNAVVTLVDAKGQPVLKDGKPLTTTTDAKGSYTLDPPLDAHNVLAQVTLPGQLGSLQAIVAGNGAAKGQRTADLDLVSTLTTGYILDQYVKPQQDPDATLDKLPANVEADTRGKASAAIVADAGAVPKDLTNGKVVDAVTALRKADKGLDEQLEVVKHILIAAGQSDQGNGQPALSVSVGTAEDLVFGADGQLVFASGDNNRVWKLLADGTLANLGGSGSPVLDSIDGLTATLAGYFHPYRLCYDPAGGLYVLELNDPGIDLGAILTGGNAAKTFARVTRIAPDGRVQQLWVPTDVKPTAILGVDATGELLLATTATAGNAVWAVGPGKPAAKLFDFPATEDRIPLHGARLPDGTLRVAFGDEHEAREVMTLDPTAHTLTSVAKSAGNPGDDLDLDAAGNVIQLDAATHTVTTTAPGGQPVTASANVGSGFKQGDPYHSAAVSPKGELFISGRSRIFGYVDGKNVAVVGADTPGGTTAAVGAITLKDPVGTCQLGDGKLFIVDDKTIVLRDLVAATTSAKIDKTDRSVPYLHTDGQGKLYYFDGDHLLHTRTADGTSAAFWNYDTLGLSLLSSASLDFAVAADGSIYLTEGGGDLAVFHHVGLDGKDTLLPTGPLGSLLQPVALGLDGQGRLLALALDELWRFDGTAWSSLIKDARLRSANNGGGLAVDAKGRIVVTVPASNLVFRFDPATGALGAIAGTGTPLLAGTGTDDGLSSPRCPLFAANGDLFLSDEGHKQVKQIPAAALP